MEAWIVIGLLIAVVIAFSTEKISVDLVTLSMLCILVMCGILIGAGLPQDPVLFGAQLGAPLRVALANRARRRRLGLRLGPGSRQDTVAGAIMVLYLLLPVRFPQGTTT